MKVITPTFSREDYLCAIQKIANINDITEQISLPLAFQKEASVSKKKEITHLLSFHIITNKEFPFLIFKIRFQVTMYQA